jgi:hypothetical protein
MPLLQGSGICLNLFYRNESYGKLELEIGNYRTQYDLELLYKTGDLFMLTQSNCACPGTIQNPSFPRCPGSSCLYKMHTTPIEGDYGYKSSSGCFLPGTATTATTIALKPLEMVNIFRPLGKKESFSIIMTSMNSNNQTNTTSFPFSNLKKEVTANGYHLTVYPEIKGRDIKDFVIQPIDEPTRLKTSPTVNDVGQFDPYKLGWVQQKGNRISYNEADLLDKLKLETIRCNPSNVMGKVTAAQLRDLYPNFKNLSTVIGNYNLIGSTQEVTDNPNLLMINDFQSEMHTRVIDYRGFLSTPYSTSTTLTYVCGWFPYYYCTIKFQLDKIYLISTTDPGMYLDPARTYQWTGTVLTSCSTTNPNQCTTVNPNTGAYSIFWYNNGPTTTFISGIFEASVNGKSQLNMPPSGSLFTDMMLLTELGIMLMHQESQLFKFKIISNYDYWVFNAVVKFDQSIQSVEQVKVCGSNQLLTTNIFNINGVDSPVLNVYACDGTMTTYIYTDGFNKVSYNDISVCRAPGTLWSLSNCPCVLKPTENIQVITTDNTCASVEPATFGITSSETKTISLISTPESTDYATITLKLPDLRVQVKEELSCAEFQSYNVSFNMLSINFTNQCQPGYVTASFNSAIVPNAAFVITKAHTLAIPLINANIKFSTTMTYCNGPICKDKKIDVVLVKINSTKPEEPINKGFFDNAYDYVKSVFNTALTWVLGLTTVTILVAIITCLVGIFIYFYFFVAPKVTYVPFASRF